MNQHVIEKISQLVEVIHQTLKPQLYFCIIFQLIHLTNISRSRSYIMIRIIQLKQYLVPAPKFNLNGDRHELAITFL